MELESLVAPLRSQRVFYQPASAVGSERIALVDVDPISRDRWSTRFSHASVPIAVIKNLQLLHVLHLKLSCFLDHLTVQQ